MTLVAEYSSFKYTDKREDWPGFIFTPLLMRHGPPPPKLKYSPDKSRYYTNCPEARAWHDRVKADCLKETVESPLLSHYSKHYREMLGLGIKNKFIRWCLDARQ